MMTDVEVRALSSGDNRYDESTFPYHYAHCPLCRGGGIWRLVFLWAKRLVTANGINGVSANRIISSCTKSAVECGGSGEAVRSKSAAGIGVGASVGCPRGNALVVNGHE
jgi:hypothetical protein